MWRIVRKVHLEGHGLLLAFYQHLAGELNGRHQ